MKTYRINGKKEIANFLKKNGIDAGTINATFDEFRENPDIINSGLVRLGNGIQLVICHERNRYFMVYR